MIHDANFLDNVIAYCIGSEIGLKLEDYEFRPGANPARSRSIISRVLLLLGN